MKCMKSLSREFDYQFISILQPVLCVGPTASIADSADTPVFTALMEQYREFYPKAIHEASRSDFINDFTEVFNDFSENPFVDDCHLQAEYQIIIARRVNELLTHQIGSSDQ